MKKMLALVAVAGLAAAASAQDILTVAGPVTAAAPAGTTISFNFANVGSIANVTSINFMATISTNPGAWTSDSFFVLTSPSAVSAGFGGDSGLSAQANPWTLGVGTGPVTGGGPVDVNLTFDVTAIGFGGSNGSWTLDLGHGWSSGDTTWSNVKVTLIPAPSALALLGLGGLVAGRRRR